jgi:hypothetical protein
MKTRFYMVLMLSGLLAALAGCAGSKVYLMEVKYLAEKKAAATAQVVGICPFEDLRKEKEKDIIGVRRHRKKHVDFIKLEGVSLSEALTQAVRDYLVENGYQVTDCKGWDKSPEGLDLLPKELSFVLGGKIDSFMIEAKSGAAITSTSYNIKLRALIGRIKERKLVTRTIESIPRDKKMGFNPDSVKSKLNDTVTDVIQRLLADGLGHKQ